MDYLKDLYSDYPEISNLVFNTIKGLTIVVDKNLQNAAFKKLNELSSKILSDLYLFWYTYYICYNEVKNTE